MAARPFQLHARKEIVTVETISRPVTSFTDRDTAEAEAELWRKAGFVAEVVDTSLGETPTFAATDADKDADPLGDEPQPVTDGLALGLDPQ